MNKEEKNSKKILFFKSAFSLVELMISLITISVVVSALAPIITKKLGGKNGVSIMEDNLTTYCEKKFTSDCKLCDGNKRCVVCEKSCPSGKDDDKCECFICTDDDFLPNCMQCNREKCFKCQGGYGLGNRDCTLCPIGKYSDGTFECRECSQGYYTATAGSTTCTLCEVGNKCNDGIKTQCLPGSYQNNSGQTTCNTCPAGTCQPNSGQSTCTNCSTGYYQNETGQTTCKTCSSKTLNCAECVATNGTCTRCNSGYYLAANKTCQPCPANGQCTNGNTISCNAGYYLSGTTCIICPNGKYSTGGATSCLTSTVISQCTTYSKTSNACSACNSGYHISGGKCVSDCTCSNGTCTASSGSSCGSCNAGYYLSNGSCVRCPAGSACSGGTAGKKSCGGLTWSGAGATSCSWCWIGNCNAGICTEVDHTSGTCKKCLGCYYLSGEGCRQK